MIKKRLFGPTDLAYQLFPLKYKWAWDSYLTMMANHWSPQEISMAPDVMDYRRGAMSGVSDEETFLFDGVMAQLTTFDLQRGIDIGESLMSRVGAPEISQALLQQAAQEALHTWSYQTCIENMGMGEERIYGMYRTVPIMFKRVKLARQWSQVADLATAKDLMDERPETIRNLILSVVFWYLGFEGVWFMASLGGPIQALARRGKFKATAEQFAYIARDETVHVDFGVAMIQTALREYAPMLDSSFMQSIVEVMRDVVEMEDEYAQYLLPKPILGYSAALHGEIARWLANRRLNAIGMQSAFQAPVNHPAPWVDEMLGGIRKEKNFFETKVQEYQTGISLNWDED